MINKPKQTLIIVVFTFAGLIMLFSGIVNGLNHNWLKMTLYYYAFIQLLFSLVMIILNFRIDNYFSHLEGFFDKNNKVITKNYKAFELIFSFSMIFLQAACLILAIVFGVHQNWFLTGIFLVFTMLICFIFSTVLFLLKINSQTNRLEKLILEKTRPN